MGKKKSDDQIDPRQQIAVNVKTTEPDPDRLRDLERLAYTRVVQAGLSVRRAAQELDLAHSVSAAPARGDQDDAAVLPVLPERLRRQPHEVTHIQRDEGSPLTRRVPEL